MQRTCLTLSLAGLVAGLAVAGCAVADDPATPYLDAVVRDAPTEASMAGEDSLVRIGVAVCDVEPRGWSVQRQQFVLDRLATIERLGTDDIDRLAQFAGLVLDASLTYLCPGPAPLREVVDLIAAQAQSLVDDVSVAFADVDEVIDIATDVHGDALVIDMTIADIPEAELRSAAYGITNTLAAEVGLLRETAGPLVWRAAYANGLSVEIRFREENARYVAETPAPLLDRMANGAIDEAAWAELAWAGQ